MSWQCDECWRADGVGEIDAMCHHCGALLCAKCRTDIVDTEPVGARPGESRTAVHCASCRRRHHPWSVAFARFAR